MCGTDFSRLKFYFEKEREREREIDFKDSDKVFTRINLDYWN